MISEFEEAVELADGISFKITQHTLTFLFLSKVTTLNSIKTLNFMITDSSDNYWLGDFDENKIASIRDSMKLKGSLMHFFAHLRIALENDSYEFHRTGINNSQAVLHVLFDLDGILLRSHFPLGEPFRRSQNHLIFNNLLVGFMFDMFNKKSNRIQELEEKNHRLYTQLEHIKKEIESGDLLKKGIGGGGGGARGGSGNSNSSSSNVLTEIEKTLNSNNNSNNKNNNNSRSRSRDQYNNLKSSKGKLSNQTTENSTQMTQSQSTQQQIQIQKEEKHQHGNPTKIKPKGSLLNPQMRMRKREREKGGENN